MALTAKAEPLQAFSGIPGSQLSHTSCSPIETSPSPDPPPHRSATLPPPPVQRRPLPQPSARNDSPLPSTFHTASPLQTSVHSPVQATIERSDTLSSIKSLDRMGFSWSGRRALPKPPVGVNSSRSLDRGLPTTAGTGLRRKQPSVVSEEGSEDSSGGKTGSSSVYPKSPVVQPATTPARRDITLPSFSFPDSDSSSEDNRSFVPERAPSPGIAFSGLPVISVSSEDSGGAVPFTAPSYEPTSVQSSSAILCSGCGEPIIGRIVNAMRQRWHPQCFKCDACADPLEHVSSYEYEGRAYCHLDYHDVSVQIKGSAD